jgi:hypothetical protein
LLNFWIWAILMFRECHRNWKLTTTKAHDSMFSVLSHCLPHLRHRFHPHHYLKNFLKTCLLVSLWCIFHAPSFFVNKMTSMQRAFGRILTRLLACWRWCKENDSSFRVEDDSLNSSLRSSRPRLIFHNLLSAICIQLYPGKYLSLEFAHRFWSKISGCLCSHCFAEHPHSPVPDIVGRGPAPLKHGRLWYLPHLPTSSAGLSKK